MSKIAFEAARKWFEAVILASCHLLMKTLHSFDCHFPNLFNKDLDAEDVTSWRLAALKLAAVWLLGMRATTSELTRYVDSMGLLSGNANRKITEGPL